jgi:DamX protein
VKIDRATLESLGLTMDPFGEPDAFFDQGDRGRLLEELRHLSRWPRRLLVITGERGVGKSTLYRALSSGLDPGVKAARINANLTSDTREVLAGIIHGFGMAAPANADHQLLIELIALHVREQIDAKRDCLVMVDDAHLLELRALEQLLKLAKPGGEDGLRMAFFAEPYFVQSLDKASKRSLAAQNWHEIRLTPLTDDEARRYVAFRIRRAGEKSGLQSRPLFSQNELSVIVGGSGGLPGRIDELASAILTGELKINDGRRWLPRMHRALVVLLLIAVGMGWLIFEGASTGPTLPDAAPVASNAQPPAPAAEATREIALPAKPTNQVGMPTTAAVDPAAPEMAPPMVSGSAPDRAEEQPKDLPASMAEPERPAPPQMATKAPESEKPKEKLVARAEPSPPPNAAVGKPRTTQWLRQQPGKYFTLQLFATASRDKRDEFIRRQDHAERFAAFETRRDGTLWYVVAYGSYSTRAEATAAAAALPSSVGRVQPWIRSFASVQASLP